LTITLRKPLLADAKELASLHVRCWKETYSQLLPDGFFSAEHQQQRLSMWQRILTHTNPDFRIALACNQEGSLVGFAFAAACSPEMEERPAGIERQLYSLYLLSDHHGSGAGQQLLDAVLGDQPALLWVAEQNPRAIAFYQRNGFVFDGQTVQDPLAPLITDARMVRLAPRA